MEDAKDIGSPSPAMSGSSCSQAEWQVRCDLATLYRLVAHFGMTDLIFTHISAAVPDEENCFLINEFGLTFDEVTASNLVKVDDQCTVVDESKRSAVEVNPAGFVIHSAVHEGRPDLKFVVHTHTAAGIAVASQKHGLLPISQWSMKFYGKLSYHDYEGVAVNLGERERLVRDLGPTNRAMLLRNHGLLVGGRTAAEAFQVLYSLERACQAQVAALSAGNDLLQMPEEEIRQLASVQTNPGFEGDEVPAYVDLVWKAAIRSLGRDPGKWCC